MRSKTYLLTAKVAEKKKTIDMRNIRRTKDKKNRGEQSISFWRAGYLRKK